MLLRVLLGSGIEGLAAIEPRRGTLVRPLLELGRQQIAAELALTGLRPVRDPTNEDVRRPRNLIRGRIAPRLLRHDGELADRLVSIAATTRRLSRSLESRLETHLRLTVDDDGSSIDLEALIALHPSLRPFALSLLHRSAGLPYPAAGSSRGELARQFGQRPSHRLRLRAGLALGEPRRPPQAVPS